MKWKEAYCNIRLDYRRISPAVLPNSAPDMPNLTTTRIRTSQPHKPLSTLTRRLQHLLDAGRDHACTAAHIKHLDRLSERSNVVFGQTAIVQQRLCNWSSDVLGVAVDVPDLGVPPERGVVGPVSRGAQGRGVEEEFGLAGCSLT